MDQVLFRHNVQMLHYDRFPILDDIAKPWTEMMLMGIDDSIASMTKLSQDQSESGAPSMQQWRDVFEKAAEERKQGVSIRMNIIVQLGERLRLLIRSEWQDTNVIHILY